MAYPTGHVEIAEGSVGPSGIEIVTATLAAAPTAKRVDRVERRISVDGDELRYTLAMAAVGEPLTAAPGGDTAPRRLTRLTCDHLVTYCRSHRNRR